MKLTLTMCILLVLVGLIGSPLLVAQDKAVHKTVITKDYDPVKEQLWQELNVAKRNGDMQRYSELAAQLESLSGAGKSDQSPKVNAYPPSPEDVSIAPSAPLWGNDVLVRAGDLGWNGQFNMATAADTLGNIYAACSIPPTTTTGTGIYVYRSTNLGVTWGLVNGIVTGRPSAIQSFGLAVTDTANGRWMIGLVLVILDSMYVPYSCGDLYSCNFLDDGSGWRYRLILAGDADTKYRSATTTTDGLFFSAGSTWFYGAAERVTPSSGDSRGIVAMSTRNNGTTWQNIDTTISGGDYDDRNPRIGFLRSDVYDSIYIAVSEIYSPTDRDVYVYVNKYNFSNAAWHYKSIAASTGDEFDPDMAISTIDQSILVPFVRNVGGNYDALLGWSSDGLRTVTRDSISTSPSNDEYFITANVVADAGSNEWRIAYRDGPDIAYKSSFGHAFHGIAPTMVNQYPPTGTLRPCVGSHKSGGAGWVGHVVYAGLGPTNMYFDASENLVDVKRDPSPVPARFSLGQNYPNPFNPATSITFDVPLQAFVTLKVYNLIGQEVATLVNESMAAGSYSVAFNSNTLSSGTYFYRISAGSFVETKKMILLK